MKLKDIISKIQIATGPNSLLGLNRYDGSLTFHCSVLIGVDVAARIGEEKVKAHVTEQVIRGLIGQIYDDRAEEFNFALNELRKNVAVACLTPQAIGAIEKIQDMASVLPPEEILKEANVRKVLDQLDAQRSALANNLQQLARQCTCEAQNREGFGHSNLCVSILATRCLQNAMAAMPEKEKEEP